MDDAACDRQAIVDVLKAETAAYLAKDYDAWAACWVQDELALRWAYVPWAGLIIDHGFEKIGREMRAAMADFPEPVLNDIRMERLEFRQGADQAWVTYDEFSEETDDPFSIGPLHRILKILHKVDGAWKIACVSVLRDENPLESCPVVVTDPAGQVQFLNEQARVDLVDHPNLTISNGRIRARGRKADKALQSAIAWAGKLVHYANQRAALLSNQTQGKVPIVLGEDDAGETSICWVKPHSGSAKITFNDAATLDQRLEVAGLVFHLSPAQLQLVRLIIGGQDSSAAATALGVSVNTVRTQLARIFDKTGVRTQQALVRILMSVGSVN